jgi:replicative DNA helicase
MSPAEDQILPVNIEAEKTILGAVLLDSEALGEVAGKLAPDDFSLDSHRRIFLRMTELAAEQRAIDIVTLSESLTRHKETEAVGGISYIAGLTEGLPLRPVIEDYVRIVKDKSVLRQVIYACNAASSRAQDQTDSPLTILSEITGRLESLSEPAGRSDRDASVSSFLPEVAARDAAEYATQKVSHIPTGVPWLDLRMGGGLRMGKYTIVGARPKVGKSAFAISTIAHNCLQGRRSVMFSLEMERHEVMLNLIPYVSELRNRIAVKPQNRTPEQQAAVSQAWETLVDWPLAVHHGDMDIDQVCWIIDRETRHGEEVLFVLDHFALLGGKGKTARDIRERYVENSSRLRRKMFTKPTCAMMVLFQLNAVPRQVEDKRPLPDDIKESKNPLEDCYAMVLLHRYIDAESLTMTRRANINLALIRGGGGIAGHVDCEFNTRRLCFDAPADLGLSKDDDDYFAD